MEEVMRAVAGTTKTPEVIAEAERFRNVHRERAEKTVDILPDDYIEKNSGIDEALYGKTHVFNPEDNKKFREALNSRNTNDIIITEGQIGKKIKRHHNDYDLDPGNVNDRIKFLNIVDDIIDNADEAVEGKWKGQEGTILFYRKGKDLVLVRKNDNTFVSVFKGGANNGWFKDLGR